MIHARNDYNRIQDPKNKIPENEPVFLLRGQDQFAPKLLQDWANSARLYGNEKMAVMVENHAKLMIKWQKENASKIPDL